MPEAAQKLPGGGLATYGEFELTQQPLGFEFEHSKTASRKPEASASQRAHPRFMGLGVAAVARVVGGTGVVLGAGHPTASLAQWCRNQLGAAGPIFGPSGAASRLSGGQGHCQASRLETAGFGVPSGRPFTRVLHPWASPRARD
jgi:hypothetical protein